MSKCFREDVNLEYSQTGPFHAFTGWRNFKMCDYTGWRNMWIMWYLNKCAMSKQFSEDVNLEYSQTGPFYAFTGWRNIKICNFTGWRNMWMRWSYKMCNVKVFSRGCEPGILSNWAISCCYWVEEHQNV